MKRNSSRIIAKIKHFTDNKRTVEYLKTQREGSAATAVVRIEVN
jgi:hypothetical protein